MTVDGQGQLLEEVGEAAAKRVSAKGDDERELKD